MIRNNSSISGLGVRDIPANVTYELLPYYKSFHQAIDLLPKNTSVAISTSTNKKTNGPDTTIERVEEAARKGLTNIVVHLAARSIKGKKHLDELLKRAVDASVKEFLVIGGDAPYNRCLPYPDSISLLKAIIDSDQPIFRIGVAGYPSGHPSSNVDERLINDLLKKQKLSCKLSGGIYIETQFDFSDSAILDWVKVIRGKGVELPIKVGLLGAVSYQKALNAMVLAGGALNTVDFMRKTHIRVEDLMTGRYRTKMIKIAQALVAANADIEGFTIYTLNDVEKTLDRYGEVLTVARQLKVG